jgi:hypothetical protein
MKIDDIYIKESEQIDELRLSNMIGGAAASKIKSAFGGGKSAATILAQEIFVKDFVSDAVSALENAKAAGLIAPPQPGKPEEETPPPEQPVAEPEQPQPQGEQPPAQPQDQAQPAAAPTKAARKQGDAGKAQAARIQAMNNYLKGVSQQMSKVQDQAQKQELSKEMINYMMDRQGTPEWENGLKTVEFILNKNTDPKFAMASIQKLKGGKQMNVNPANAPKGNVAESRWQAYWMNRLAEACGFTLKQLGFTVLQEHRTKVYRIVETRYYKMNNIFESIMEAGEQPAQTGVPFGKFMRDWFGQYMQGVDYTTNKPALYQIIDAMEDTYNNKKGKIDTGNLQKLAQGGWAASKAVGVNPTGAQDAAGAGAGQAAGGEQPAAAGGQAAQGQAQPAAQAQGGQAAQPAQAAQAAGGAENGYQIAQRIKSELNKLYKIDQVVYNDLVKSLQTKPVKSDEPPAVATTGQEKPNTLGGAGYTSAQPAQGAQVSESAKRAAKLQKLLAERG